MLAIIYRISGVNINGGVCVYDTISPGKTEESEHSYWVIGSTLILLKCAAIWDGWNQDGSFLRVTTNTDGDSAATLL
jgi:hypothetical protein